MNTVGFKKQRAEFQDLLYQNVERMGAQSSETGTVVPTGIQIGNGVKAGATYRIMTQGAPTRTEGTYDLAIEGKGYFQILMPSGETAYTRAGNFAVNDQGQLVTDDGYLVQPAITVPQGVRDVAVSKTGQVQVVQDGVTEPTIIGQLEIATFFNEAGLEAMGDNLFLESGASGAPNISTPGDVGYGTLLQGYIEASNVDAVSEITSLIVAQRAYEMNSKVITTADEMLSVAGQLRS
ncbi:MAG: flagellar basal-body rod protein FlgG [Asticcacaulis sp. 32-58-5]|nr:MAG: flagellar basal-body rod protein FlgG [Asticcacaulis sp. 32-58-5]